MTEINRILDSGSFVEIGSGVSARYDIADAVNKGDGVVTGYGTINGTLVYVYAQDASFKGGSLSEMNARKISKIYDMAIAMKAPVIALIDCAGLRLQEANDALYSMGCLFSHQAKASGIVPQFTAIFGTCGGGMTVSAAMSDFIFMENEGGKLFVNSPNAVEGNYEDKCDTACACYQSEKTGLCDFTGNTEEVCTGLRELVTLLPHSNVDDFSDVTCGDNLNRSVAGIENIKDKDKQIAQIGDDGRFFEVKKNHASCMVTGFIKLNGSTVGVIANGKEELCACGCSKATKFADFCDAFNIPVLVLTDASGFKRNIKNENKLARALAKLSYTFAHLTVPSVTVITGKAYGTAGVVMNSKGLGADLVYAWPNAKMGIMDKSVLDDITDAVDKNINDAVYNAGRGYIDDIIAPEETRQRLAAAFEMLYTKDEMLLPKKHGTV